MLEEVEMLQAPYFRYLPPAAEASINAARQVFADPNLDPDNFSMKISISSLEAPSAYVGIRLHMKELGIAREKLDH